MAVCGQRGFHADDRFLPAMAYAVLKLTRHYFF